MLLLMISMIPVLYLGVSLFTFKWLDAHNNETKLRVKNYEILLSDDSEGLVLIKIMVMGDPNALHGDAIIARNDVERLYKLYKQTVMDRSEIFRFSLLWPVYWHTYFWVKYGKGQEMFTEET